MDALTRSLMMAASSTPVVLRPATCTGNISASLTFATNGTATAEGSTGWTWLLRGSAADYEASYALISGKALQQAAGTWFSLASNRTFQRFSNPVGSSVVEMSIRHAATGAIVARAVMTFTTTVSRLSVGASPLSDTTEFDSTTINSATFTCTATGGGGGYNYQWVKISGDAIGFAGGSTSSTAIFQATGMAPGESRTAQFRCNVTSSDDFAITTAVTVTLKRPA